MQRTSMLLSPLAKGAMCVAAAVVPALLFNVFAPLLLPAGASFVPTFDFLQDAIFVTMLGAVVVVLVAACRKTLPLPAKLAYVVALLAAQLTLTAGAEYALFESRGGLKLFGPTLQSTTYAPDGRAAFVYTAGGFACGWDVQTSSPLSPIMRPALSVPRASCSEPVPRVEFGSDGSVDLRDAAGNHLETQRSPGLGGLFWHGC